MKTWAKKEGTEPPQTVSSQSHNLYDFLNNVLVKLFHNFVKVKL